MQCDAAGRFCACDISACGTTTVARAAVIQVAAHVDGCVPHHHFKLPTCFACACLICTGHLGSSSAPLSLPADADAGMAQCWRRVLSNPTWTCFRLVGAGYWLGAVKLGNLFDCVLTVTCCLPVGVGFRLAAWNALGTRGVHSTGRTGPEERHPAPASANPFAELPT